VTGQVDVIEAINSIGSDATLVLAAKARGMCVFPRVPTKEMLHAAWSDALGEDAAGVWLSMIKASETSEDGN